MHLDSLEPDQARRSWAVFCEARAEWADRVLLQAVALVPIDAFRTTYGRELADLVAASGGILGGVTGAVGGFTGGCSTISIRFSIQYFVSPQSAVSTSICMSMR